MGKIIFTIVSAMNIRDEILQSSRGTQARLWKSAGLTRQTLYLLLYKRQGSNETAKAFATAFGAPQRWYQFFEDSAPQAQPPSSLDPAV